jgi:hypothetical protein
MASKVKTKTNKSDISEGMFPYIQYKNAFCRLISLTR